MRKVGLGLGVLLVAGGLSLALHKGQERAAAHVAALPRASPEQFAGLALGAQVLVQGKVAAVEALSSEGFVIYDEEEYRGRETSGASKGRDRWLLRSAPEVRFAIQQGGVSTVLCNQRYILAGTLQPWQSDVVPTFRDDFRQSTIRRRGLRPGDTVTVEGQVTGATGKRCLTADTAFGGTAAQYLEFHREGIWVLRVVGGVFAGIGALLLCVLGVLAALAARREEPSSAPDSQRQEL